MKRFFQIVALGAAVIFCCGCGYGSVGVGEKHDGADGKEKVSVWRYTDTAMGTVIQQSLYTAGEDAAKEISTEIIDYLTGLERDLLSWRLETSETYRLNASAGSGEGYLLSEDMTALLQSCMELQEQSGGAFDVTLGTVTRLWNIDQWAAGRMEDFQMPSSRDLANALDACGSHKLALETEDFPQSGLAERTLAFLPEGMQLDLGAVGKGHALSGIQILLEQTPEITGAVISVGGSVLTYGSKPDGGSWKVGIVNPFDTAAYIGILTLQGQWCVSTSGDYERYVEMDGARYHHILDPATGYPADSGVRGVTILSKDGMLSDGLSTACFILGPEKGMELAERYGAEALFVLKDGSIVMTEEMGRYFNGACSQ